MRYCQCYETIRVAPCVLWIKDDSIIHSYGKFCIARFEYKMNGVLGPFSSSCLVVSENPGTFEESFWKRGKRKIHTILKKTLVSSLCKKKKYIYTYILKKNTPYMLHMTRGRRGELNLLSKFKLPNSYGLGELVFWRYFHKGSLNILMN